MLLKSETALLLLTLADCGIVLACLINLMWCCRQCRSEILKPTPHEPSNDRVFSAPGIIELHAELIKMARLHELERVRCLKLFTQYTAQCPRNGWETTRHRLFLQATFRRISHQRPEVRLSFKLFTSLPAELVLKLTDTVVLYLLSTLHLSKCLADIPKKWVLIRPADSTEQIARSEDPGVSSIWKYSRTRFFARSVEYDYRFV